MIQKIQILVGVTQADFKKLYVTPLERFSIYQESLIKHKEHDIEVVIKALKRRRGYLLPIGADSETSFREAEEWTYAIFIAALLKEVDCDQRMEAMKIVLPEMGYAWLQRNAVLFEELMDYLEENKKTIFDEVVDGEQIEENLPPLNLPVINESEANKPDHLKAKYFFIWLRQELAEGSLVVNQDNAFIHYKNEGIIIFIPEILDEFFKSKNKEEIEKSILIKWRIALTKEIKKQGCLVKNQAGSRIHNYRFKSGSKKEFQAFVISSEKLLNTKVNLNLNSDLIKV